MSREIKHPGKAQARLNFIAQGICPICKHAKLHFGLKTCLPCNKEQQARLAKYRGQRRNPDRPIPGAGLQPEISVWDLTETALERAIHDAEHDLNIAI